MTGTPGRLKVAGRPRDRPGGHRLQRPVPYVAHNAPFCAGVDKLGDVIVLGRIDDDGRDCAGCNTYKPWADFNRQAKGPCGHNSICRACRHNRYRASSPDRVPVSPCRVDSDGRECVECRDYKPWSSFGMNAKGVDGRAACCLACDAVRRRLWKESHPEQYAKLKLRGQARDLGLDPEVVERHFASHHGLCDVCGRSPGEVVARIKRLSIDHDHETRQFRGLLCANCNTALGLLQDDPEILYAAAEYLLRATGNGVRQWSQVS
jgi:Recombination endonuclease VII